MSGRMGFVGVSTGGSAVQRVFPAWARVLDLPTDRLEGFDLPVGATPELYRDLVVRLRDDPDLRGALVTTHKVGVYAAAHDLFDELDDLARTFGEISAIYKRDGRLYGAARDPITVRLALEDFLPDDHFTRTGAAVLCLGAGGAGAALAHQLGVRRDAPSRVVVTAVTRDRLEHLDDLLARAGVANGRVQTVLVDGPADALLTDLPPGSLVVNATGLGKDAPGSPLTDAARFPDDGYAWEFNYRGDLDFLAQARRAPQVTPVDGWRYFVHGWSRVVADVFDLPMPPDQVERLAAAAEAVR